MAVGAFTCIVGVVVGVGVVVVAAAAAAAAATAAVIVVVVDVATVFVNTCVRVCVRACVRACVYATQRAEGTATDGNVASPRARLKAAMSAVHVSTMLSSSSARQRVMSGADFSSSSEDEAEARGRNRKMSIAEAFGGVKSERSETSSDDEVSSNHRSIAVGIKYGCN